MRIFTEEHRKKLSENKKRFYNKTNPKPQLCACGCGQITNIFKYKANKFIHGHNQRNTKSSDSCKEKLSIQKRGDLNPSKRIEVRQQISNTLKEYYTDITKHPRWEGGLSFEPYGKEFNFKLKEFIRDVYKRTCQICGKSEEDNKNLLDIHHIDYNKKNNTFNNLIPLCHSCHMKTNKNRNQWELKLTTYGKN